MGFKTTSNQVSGRGPVFVSCFQPRATHFVYDLLELCCVVSGNPAPQVTWRFNDQLLDGNDPRLKLTDGNRRLFIRLLRLEDAGVYTCVAKNQFKEVERSCNVIIKEHPVVQPPEIIQQPQDVQMSEGHEAVISCITPYSKQIFFSTLWMKNGQVVDETRHVKYRRELLDDHTMKNTLKFLNVKATDEGRYALQVVNMVGKTTSEEASLHVI